MKGSMNSLTCEICRGSLVNPLQTSCGHYVCCLCLGRRCRHGVNSQCRTGCRCPAPECDEDHGMVFIDRAVEREIEFLNNIPSTLLQQNEETTVTDYQNWKCPVGLYRPFNLLREKVNSCLTLVQEVKNELEFTVNNTCDSADVGRAESRIFEVEQKCLELYPETRKVHGVDFVCTRNFQDSKCNIRDVSLDNLMVCKGYNLLKTKLMELLYLGDKVRSKAMSVEQTFSVRDNLERSLAQRQQRSSTESPSDMINNQRYYQALNFQVNELAAFESLKNIVEKDDKLFEIHYDEKEKVVNISWCLEKMSYRFSVKPSISFLSRPINCKGSDYLICVELEDGVKIYLKCTTDPCGLVKGKISCPFLENGTIKEHAIEVRPQNTHRNTNILHLRDISRYLMEDCLRVQACLWMSNREDEDGSFV